MLKHGSACALVAGIVIAGAFAQPAKVDFGRDIQPLFRQNCFGCHGPSQQINGLRLDRRSSVFKSGVRRVVPGSSENSFLYHRLTGDGRGLTMPPSGPLRPEQIATVKAWIDQGADWPDALANEADLPPANPKAVAMVESLRAGDRQSFLKSVAEDPALLNARGPEGSTPFMYAVLYGDAALIEQLIAKGADPNRANDSKGTALMWAATNLEKTRVLLTHGANVNAMSDEMRTPLSIAAGKPGGAPIVKLLLDRGADPNLNTQSTPLMQAALAAEPDTMQFLLDRGAALKPPDVFTLSLAITRNCARCIDILMKKDLDKMAYTVALIQNAAYADAKTTRLLLDHGAEVNAPDPFGRTALMYAASSDLLLVDVVKLLMERGADINAVSKHPSSRDTGLTVLDLARLQGETPVVDLLVKAGARSSARPITAPKPQPADSVRSAIQRSLPALQRADAGFTAKSGCVSCHNNSFAAMAVSLGRKNGLPIDDRLAAQQVKVNAAYLEHQRESLHEGSFLAQAGAEALGDVFGPFVLGNILIGLDAEHYKPDLNTDAVVMYLQSHQAPDGSWPYPSADFRPPIGNEYIGQTALAMRALQLYAPKVDKAEYEKSIQRAAAWLAQAQPRTGEDRIARLQGLVWAGKDKAAIQSASRDVLRLQRSDGSWSDLPTTDSSAYDTGKALVALQAAGVKSSDAAIQRGIAWLLKTQLEDGSWFVKTRALALQPFFDSGFPHGVDQFISAAGTSWAAMALSLAQPPPARSTSAAN